MSNKTKCIICGKPSCSRCADPDCEQRNIGQTCKCDTCQRKLNDDKPTKPQTKRNINIVSMHSSNGRIYAITYRYDGYRNMYYLNQYDFEDYEVNQTEIFDKYSITVRHKDLKLFFPTEIIAQQFIDEFLIPNEIVLKLSI